MIINIILKWRTFTQRANTRSKSTVSRHLLVQSKQWKHQNNVYNLFKGNNKDIRKTYFTQQLITVKSDTNNFNHKQNLKKIMENNTNGSQKQQVPLFCLS